TKLFAIFAFALLTLIIWLKSSYNVGVQRDHINIKSVKRGDLPLVINTYGKLISQDTRILTTPVAATVEKIHLKPGAQVNKDSIILELVNPELNQKVEAAQLALHQANTKLKKLEIELQDQQLQHQSNIALLKAELKSARLQYTAEKNLENSGTISKLQIQTSAITVEQLEVRLAIAEQRINHLKAINQTRLSVEKELVKLAKSQLSLQLKNKESLIVRSNIDGVLQRLPVELGENIVAGAKLAEVGSVSNLDAELKLPQSHAAEIALGNPVMLTVAMQPVSAVVSRIDPVVTNGYVTIEAKIEQPLPKSARPEINIQGFITSNVITDALYVETPANITSHSKVDMFLVDDAEQIAEATTVSFGRIVGQYIEVLNGVEANQQLVISDMQQWQNYKQIALIN
uniref:efflux RND transporter periplasmic adaptor subunit n=1 Tax=Pseudoalteromonas sp. TaxID=53249 RepID=UPI003569A57D